LLIVSQFIEGHYFPSWLFMGAERRGLNDILGFPISMHLITGRALLAAMGFCGLALTVAGCGGGPKPVSDTDKKHFLHVVELSQEYQTANNKKANSITELKDWAIKEGKATEADFTSPRDQETYGLTNGMVGLTLYEQTGKNGKVFLYSTGAFREATPEEVSRMKGLANMRRGGPPGMK
jgi:hypothetical protein